MRGSLGLQAMVFGNLGRTSAAGVCFSRNPSTGAKCLYGGYAIGAQGEDVVTGRCQPIPITQMKHDFHAAYGALVANCAKLELLHRDMQVNSRCGHCSLVLACACRHLLSDWDSVNDLPGGLKASSLMGSTVSGGGVHCARGKLVDATMP
jgi:hypothetical protein